MAHVLQFERSENITCDNCFKESQVGIANIVWDFSHPLTKNSYLRIILFKNGWIKNEIVNSSTVNDEEEIINCTTVHLCPLCNQFYQFESSAEF
jgi:hypothetical protein